MKRQNLIFLILPILFFGSCQQKTDNEAIQTAVMGVLHKSVADWNSGNIASYMACYEHSDSLQFDGNSTTTYGWEQSLARYKKAYPDKKAMGTLRFSRVKIRVLSPTAAFVSGRWELIKANSHPEGLFTLLFRQTGDGWRIIYDHSSSKIQ